MGFFGSLFGSDQAKAAKQAAQKQTLALDKASDILDERIGVNQELFNPLIQAGQAAGQQSNEAQDLLRDALGVNGPERQRAFFDNFQNDPGFNEAVSRGVEGIDRSASARGGLFSGRNLSEVADFVTKQNLNNAFQTRLSNLAGLSDRISQDSKFTQGLGANATGALAGINTGLQRDRANFRIQQGDADAQGLVNAASARAAGVGNALSLAGNIASFATQPINSNSLIGKAFA